MYYLLPQLHIEVPVRDPLTNIRFAATASYSRPNFGDIVPSQGNRIEWARDNGSIVESKLVHRVTSIHNN